MVGGIVGVTENFPQECRHVLEKLASVYHDDALTRERGLSPVERLLLHQEHSVPVMKPLHGWMTAQLEELRTGPNSGLGKAITYLLNHWTKLTLFLRQPGAPIDKPGKLYAFPREKSIRYFMDQARALAKRRVPLKTQELIVS
jgi:transposase